MSKLFGASFGELWDKINEFIKISWDITYQEYFNLEMQDERYKPDAFFVKGSKAKEKGELKSRTDFMECWEAWLREGETAFKDDDDAPEETKLQAGRKLWFFRKYFSTASPVLASSPVSLYAAVSEWLKEAARIAKMANFEAFIWEQENRIIKDFYNLPRQQLEKETQGGYFERMRGKKEVKVLYSSEDDVLKAAVEYNSGLTKGLENEFLLKNIRPKKK